MPYHYFSDEEIRFLKRKAKGRGYAAITGLFNAHFNLRGKKKLSISKIANAMRRYGLSIGRDTRFKSGHIPHNKGIKGWGADHSGRFKSGHIPYNARPVGAERIMKGGYIEVKTGTNEWKMKSLVVWEEARGALPKGVFLIFGDGDNTNVSLDNLIPVTRSELSVMNRWHLISKDADLTRTGKLVADVKIASAKRRRAVR